MASQSRFMSFPIVVFLILVLFANPVRAVTLKAELLVSGLDKPVYVTAPTGDANRLFILEARGVVRIMDLSTNSILSTPFLDIDSIVQDPIMTNGLTEANFDYAAFLCLAFHPDYASNGLFFVTYMDAVTGELVLARYSVSGSDPNVADAGSGVPILSIQKPFYDHNSGWIGFSPVNGYLYMSVGDGGEYCDPGQRAQNKNLLLGKILRLDINSATYTIPGSNPFASGGGAPEVWAYGFSQSLASMF